MTSSGAPTTPESNSAYALSFTDLIQTSEKPLQTDIVCFGPWPICDTINLKSNLQVTSPGGMTVYALKGTSGEKFEFKAPQSGAYKFCFDNPAGTPETVSFYIHVGHIPTEFELAKDGQLNSNFYPFLSFL